MEIMTDQRFRRTIKYLRALLILGSIALALSILFYIGILIYAKILGPPPLAVPQSSLYYSDDGTLIGESHNGQKRYWVELNDISPDLVNATLAIEDKSFYDHHGFDFKRIAGAALADIKAMAKVQGASTISQQYARNLFLEHDKTWKRKLHEAFYTIRIEMNYTKNEILEGYLNTIYYGEGAYGIQAASQFYFGKNASDINLAEAAMLAGIPKGPSIYSPLASEEKSKKRQQLILNMMEKDKMITAKEAENAYSAELKLNGEHTHSVAKVAPYFQDAVKSALKNVLQLDERTIELGGLRVYTTLDTKQQEIAEKNIERLIAKDSKIQVGLVAMNPKNGHVKAMVGGRNYEESPFNRATQAVRQPGSTMKPFLYYKAIEQGFTPSTTMRSELTTFRFDDNRPEYTPHNYNNLYAEKEISMAQAIALSDNVYAVKTHLFLGEEALVETAKRIGISTKLQQVPSLALGTSGVRVVEMANAYSHFANGGKKVNPVLITRVENHKGEVIYEHQAEDEYVLRPDVAFVTTHMMTGMFDRKLNGYTSVTGSTVINDMTRIYAGKSGSTNTDNWMIGFAPQLVTAVWTGYDQGNPIEIVAEKGYAKNIWVHFMEEALEDEPIKNFKAPKGTVGVYINPENGKLATKDCPVQRLSYYVAGTEPTEYCTDHILNGEEHPHEKEPTKEKKEKVPWYKKIFQWG
jgi:penicillin-binding protein 2D